MFGKYRNMQAYKQSLLKIKEYTNEFDVVYAAHGTFGVPVSLVDDLLAMVVKIENEEILYEEILVGSEIVRQYSSETARFLLDR